MTVHAEKQLCGENAGQLSLGLQARCPVSARSGAGSPLHLSASADAGSAPRVTRSLLHPGLWLVPPHSPAPCLSVGPRAGSLTSSPWPSPDGPRGETPRTTGFQTPGVISVRSPAILSCLTTLPLPTEAPAAFSAPVLRLGGPHSYASADVLGTSVLQNPNAAHVGTLPFLVVKQKPDIKGVGALKNPKFSSLILTHLYHNLCWKP